MDPPNKKSSRPRRFSLQALPLRQQHQHCPPDIRIGHLPCRRPAHLLPIPLQQRPAGFHSSSPTHGRHPPPTRPSHLRAPAIQRHLPLSRPPVPRRHQPHPRPHLLPPKIRRSDLNQLAVV